MTRLTRLLMTGALFFILPQNVRAHDDNGTSSLMRRSTSITIVDGPEFSTDYEGSKIPKTQQITHGHMVAAVAHMIYNRVEEADYLTGRGIDWHFAYLYGSSTVDDFRTFAGSGNFICYSRALNNKNFFPFYHDAKAFRLERLREGLQKAAKQGSVIIQAAGNDGLTLWKGVPDQTIVLSKEDSLVLVGAVDELNQLCDFSSRAGDYKNIFICAPGKDIGAPLNFGEPDAFTVSGTSFSAPQVTLALALLHMTGLSPEESIQYMFKTAIKTDQKGDLLPPELYGQGILHWEPILQRIWDTQLEGVVPSK